MPRKRTRRKIRSEERRFPFENLYRLPEIPIKDREQFLKPTKCDWARHLGVRRETIYVWIVKGIPEFQADRIAVKSFGLHPSLIWPEWFPIES